jgi:hypothetical protein
MWSSRLESTWIHVATDPRSRAPAIAASVVDWPDDMPDAPVPGPDLELEPTSTSTWPRVAGAAAPPALVLV